jgi:S1-C subfamily serine protease
MSENWHTSNNPEDPAVEGPATSVGSQGPAATPLPPANSNQGAHYPDPSLPNPPSEPAPTGPQPTVGLPTPPTGVPVPPSSVTAWAPPTQAHDPYAGGWGGWGGPGGGTPPPYAGWPYPGPASVGPQPTPSNKRSGLVATLATLVVVMAVLVGVGLGRVVWPSASTTSASGSTGGVSGGSGSSGGQSSPFGGGSSGGGSSSGGESSPFGGGSSGGETSPFGGGSSGGSGNSSTGAGAPSDIATIASKVDPGLVDINTNLSYQNEQAAGTGMVLTSNGVILTNNHVIDGATSISVTDVGNGKTYSANVVGYDRTGDVAVIKATGASGLQTVSFASGTPSVGQAVVGVGNAGGAGGTPSAAGGSVIATDQSITASDDNGGNSENLTGLIEINAGIQPGDSGGSLVNASGQVMGMDTAASGSSYQTSGSQAYAIPIGTALSIAKKIEAGQQSSTIHIGETGFLGISVEANSGGNTDGNSGGFGGGGFGGGEGSGSGSGTSGSGAVVNETLSGSPAAQAGLAQGDVITALNGQTINSPTDLTNGLEPEHPGDTVQLQWTDQSGQTHTASVQLKNGPPA